MSQQLPPGWTDAFTRGVSSPDEATRAEALGVQPRRCFRVSEADTARSAARGRRRGYRSRWALKALPPVKEEP